MTPETRHNQATWDAWTETRTTSEHHRDVQRFQATGSSLRSIELAEVGEVVGKTLLHLQCNMGADTLSWAKRGATVTGIDLSEAAVARARDLAAAAHIPARFLATDLYALPAALNEQFDIVFTSYGVLWWLGDLPRWAEIAAAAVKPGGIFYIVDMHPFTNCIAVAPADDSGVLDFTVTAPYAHPPMSLQALNGDTAAPVRTWTYGLGEVVTALTGAGLQIEWLHEHPMQFYQQFPFLAQDAQGWWRWPPPDLGLPLLFSLRARKLG